ncbi:hypothetical protein COLO4_01476 [Corchorus olitorius]|uniref:Uncharacterized protein n=1 Tax=Corchorus olitorius TaxID=93759 RepID=A0A1R3L2G6_9ROSI|nr:hypothetical protein COLO4_01476 [Corchorus olitorius]
MRAGAERDVTQTQPVARQCVEPARSHRQAVVSITTDNGYAPYARRRHRAAGGRQRHPLPAKVSHWPGLPVSKPRLNQAIVANSFGGIQGFLQIAHLKDLLLFHIVAPDAGKAVGLKFHFNGQLIDLALTGALLHLAYTGLNAQQLLHMVADFVCNYITLRKITACAQFVFHFVIERKIDVDGLVCRAIKRSHNRLPGPAAGARGTAIHYQFGWRVLLMHLSEQLVPGIFGRRQNDRAKASGHNRNTPRRRPESA